MPAIALLLVAPLAAAQQAAVPAATPRDQATNDNTATLETITVTAKREEELDLYKFKNPLDVKDNTFGKDYREPPSVEEISKNGGIIPYAVGYLAGKVRDGARMIPGWKQQQTVVARPPPLSDEQLQRAVKLQQNETQPAATSSAGAAATSR